MSFQRNLKNLIQQLDPASHSAEIAILGRCRGIQDLEGLAQRGWLTSEGPRKRLKLVRHGSGTFLVVEYEDGWSKTMAQQPFPR